MDNTTQDIYKLSKAIKEFYLLHEEEFPYGLHKKLQSLYIKLCDLELALNPTQDINELSSAIKEFYLLHEEEFPYGLHKKLQSLYIKLCDLELALLSMERERGNA